MAQGHSNNGASSRRPSTDGIAWPHNAECEASILGGIILRNSLLGELAELETDAFYVPKHRIVFGAMRNLEAAGKPIDSATLEHEIEKAGKLDAMGGVGFLGELALSVPTVDNVHAYAQIVAQAHRNRLAILSIASAFERAKTWQHDPAELISEVAGELGRLEHEGKQIAEKKRARWCIDFETFLGDGEPDDDDAQDWVIRDLVPRGEPTLWGGPMKGGKTWSVMDLMIAVARGESWLGFENTWGGPARVLGLLLEDNKRRIRKRLWELCRSRFLTPNDPTIRQHLKISRAPIRLPDASEQRRLIAELKEFQPALVVIDNLTRVMVGDPNSTRDAAAFARAWTEISDATGACIMFLHHTKKPVGDQKDVDPFDNLRGSGDFGACARNIIVTTPIRTETDEKLAEVRMRGNLDLRRDSFVLGFERSKNHMDRWQAKIVDRGEVSTVKEEASKKRKENKEQKKKDEAASQFKRRVDRAIELCRAEGSVSMQKLATEFGLNSPNSMRPVFVHLVQSGAMIHSGRLGYVFKDSRPIETQGALL